jgi:hypothetical protein
MATHRTLRIQIMAMNFSQLYIHLQISEHNWGGGDATNKQTNKQIKVMMHNSFEQTKMMGMDRLSGNIWW